MCDPAKNHVLVKSKTFALRIIRIFDYLREDKKEYVLSSQLLRSGTSIGANVREAVRAQSRADFRAKMNIALKEASETEYWLELLLDSGKIPEAPAKSVQAECFELLRILTAIVRSTDPTLEPD